MNLLNAGGTFLASLVIGSTITISGIYPATNTPVFAPISPAIASSTPKTIEDTAKEILSGTPLLNVAICESGLRQFNKDGSVLRGKVNSDDKGILQINTFYHQSEADILGYDLETLEGNLLFGRWLYLKQGLAPWSASKECWSNLSIKT